MGLLLLAMHGAANAATDCDSAVGFPIYQNIEWTTLYDTLTTESSCTQNCHNGTSPAGDLNLSSQNLAIYFLVGQPSSQNPNVQRVIPGDPQNSLLFQKVACAGPDVGSRMPPGGHLPLQWQAMVYDWIEQGAYGENPEDPIPRDYIFRDSLEFLRR
ncbi:MAG: hypothetical protein IPK27_01655 [Rhodanobacteraceae bacterium]|nr:hypothetical protein [Rhodanobacteraceae bacterium]